MRIGNKIKQLRQTLMLTQDELASRCSLSPGFISQVERDCASPSIATLEDILVALGETLESFFNERKDKVIIGCCGDVPTKTFEEGYQVDWIVPNAANRVMEPIYVTIDVGGQTRFELPHEGEEFGYVLSGNIALIVNDKAYDVCEKKSFYFVPNKDHYIKNTGKTKATLLWVSSPPFF